MPASVLRSSVTRTTRISFYAFLPGISFLLSLSLAYASTAEVGEIQNRWHNFGEWIFRLSKHQIIAHSLAATHTHPVRTRDECVIHKIVCIWFAVKRLSLKLLINFRLSLLCEQRRRIAIADIYGDTLCEWEIELNMIHRLNECELERKWKGSEKWSFFLCTR